MLIPHHETPDDNDWSKPNQHMKPKSLREVFRSYLCYNLKGQLVNLAESELGKDVMRDVESFYAEQKEREIEALKFELDYETKAAKFYKDALEKSMKEKELPAPSPQKALPEVEATEEKFKAIIENTHIACGNDECSCPYGTCRAVTEGGKQSFDVAHQHTLQVIEKVVPDKAWANEEFKIDRKNLEDYHDRFNKRIGAHTIIDEIRNRLNNIK